MRNTRCFRCGFLAVFACQFVLVGRTQVPLEIKTSSGLFLIGYIMQGHQPDYDLGLGDGDSVRRCILDFDKFQSNATLPANATAEELANQVANLVESYVFNGNKGYKEFWVRFMKNGRCLYGWHYRVPDTTFKLSRDQKARQLVNVLPFNTEAHFEDRMFGFVLTEIPGYTKIQDKVEYAYVLSIAASLFVYGDLSRQCVVSYNWASGKVDKIVVDPNSFEWKFAKMVRERVRLPDVYY